MSGVPNSGKSEWLDALAVNLALAHGWRFALCSMEKRPRDHARQLLEKIAGLPLLPAAYADGTRRMNPLQLREAYATLCEHFVVIAAGEGSMPSISWVLEKAKAAKIQYVLPPLQRSTLASSLRSSLRCLFHVSQRQAWQEWQH